MTNMNETESNIQRLYQVTNNFIERISSFEHVEDYLVEFCEACEAYMRETPCV